MPEEVTKHSSRKKLLFYIPALLILLTAIALASAKYYFSFVDIDINKYPSHFYAWRVTGADKAMFNQGYRLVRINTYDNTQEDQHNYVQLAQGDADMDGKITGTPMLMDGYPEHFPRGHVFQYTLFSEKLPMGLYEEYLEFRKAVVKEDGQVLDAKVLEGKKEVSTKELFLFDKQEGKTKVFEDNKKYRDILRSIVVVVNKLYKNEYTKKVLSDEDPEVVKDVQGVLSAAGITGVTDDAIKAFFVNMGRVNSSPWESFAYSRVFYVLLFALRGSDMVPEDRASDKEKAKKGYKSPKNLWLSMVGDCMAQLFSRVYGSKSEDVGAFRKTMRNWFGMGEIEMWDESENIKKMVAWLETVAAE